LVGSPLERRERVVGATGVDRGDPEPFQERWIVRCLGQALGEQHDRLVRSSLAELVPAPALEAADHVLTSRHTRRIVRGGEAELLARARKLPGRV